MAHLDRNGELAFGDDPDNATGELMSLRAQVAALTAEFAKEKEAHALEKRAHERTWTLKAKMIDERNVATARAEAAEAKAGRLREALEAARADAARWAEAHADACTALDAARDAMRRVAHEARCPKNLEMETASLRSRVITMRKALLLVSKLELHDKSLHEGAEGDALRAMRAVRAALKEKP